MDLSFKENPIDKVTLDSILAGSIRGNARLQHSHGIMAKCMYGTPKEDQEYIFHQCPNLEEVRKPYREAIQAVVQESAYTRQGLEDLVRNNAFRNCGLVPESEGLNQI